MIIARIDEYLKGRPRDKRPIRCFHPSSLHKSPRELYWHYLLGDTGQDVEPRVLRIFDNGHGVHTRLQAYLKETGVLRRSEVPVENRDYEIKGHTDGIIRVNGVDAVLEIKSMNSNRFYSCYEPKPDHLIQVNIYMFCLGIPRGCILCECKDNQELKEFYVRQSPEVLTPMLEKIRFVQACVRAGKEPD